MGKRRRALCILLLLSSLLLLPDAALSWHIEQEYEFGFGVGVNLNGHDTRQVLIAPGVNWFMDTYEPLVLRLEADIEFIDFGDTVFSGGIAPFLRYTHPLRKCWKPFMEIGGGVNLISRKEIAGRDMGGGFQFSFMVGAGVEFRTEKNRAIRVSTRFRHLSNAKVYADNQSFNSQYLMMSIGF